MKACAETKLSRPHSARRSWYISAAVCVCTLAAQPLMATGAAAYWGGLGAGAAAASTSTGSPRLSVSALVDSSLSPGAGVPVEITVVNGDDRPFRLESIRSAATQVSAGQAGCDFESVRVVVTGRPVEISPAGRITIVAELRMDADADPACQGRTFTVPLTAVGTSA
jgi:hypothetical protein